MMEDIRDGISIKPIAYIRTDFKEKFGIPRQSGRAESITGKIVFLPGYRDPDMLRGIEGFTHLWLIFDFSESHREGFSTTVRPPRLGGNRRIGVFASRSPFRPNPIGLSSVKLQGIQKTENDGTVLIVSGADLLNNTPIYDIKPYIRYTDSHPDALSGYADEFSDYRLEVYFPEKLAEMIPEEKRKGLIECIADDPRPSYQDDSDRIYSMMFGEYDVHFRTDGRHAEITGVDIKNIK